MNTRMCAVAFVVILTEPPVAAAPQGQVVPCAELGLGASDQLSTRLTAARFDDLTMDGIVMKLRDEHHVPLSFVAGADDTRITFDASGETVRELLDALTARIRAYRYQLIEGRLVVFPRDPIYDAIINAPAKEPLARYAAAAAYVEALRKQRPEFSRWLGPVAVGTDPKHWVFTERVTLRPRGTVIEHLLDLAGPAGDLAFYVTNQGAFPGLWVIDFADVNGFRRFVVTMNPATLRVGGTSQLSVVGEAWDGRRIDLTLATCGTRYSSLLPEIATVDVNGSLAGKSKGRTLMRVSNRGTTANVVIEVLAEPAAPKSVGAAK